MRHVRGKGREALLDALLVADVGVDVRVDGDDGVRRRRQIAARLGEQHHHAERLHADRLAARVRAGDEQHAVVLADADVYRHDFVLRDEGMARLAKVRAALAVELRAVCLHHLREARLGEGEVEVAEDAAVLGERPAVLVDLGGQVAQDALDLLLLGERQLLDVVVELDDGHRLDEERRARGRLVVDDAREARAVLLLDGDDVALVAHGDDGVLEEFLVLGIVEDARDALLDVRLGGVELAADAPQLDARVLAHGAVLVDGVVEQALELAEDLDAPRPRLERRRLHLAVAEEVLDISHRVEGAHDARDLVEVEHGPHLHFLQMRPDVEDAAERRCGRREDGHGLCRLLDPLDGFVEVARRQHRLGALLADQRGGTAREHLPDPVVFHDLIGFLFHQLPLSQSTSGEIRARRGSSGRA